MRTLTLAAAAAFILAVPATAQQAADGLTGTRVRVTAPNFLPAPVTGIVTAYREEGLSVATEGTADTVLLPLRSISRLDKYAGGSRGSTAWYRGRWGAFIGGGLGLVSMPLIAKVTDLSMGESAAVGGAIGMGTGLTIGLAWGASSPRERWTWTMQPWGYDPSLHPQPTAP
jgi:hypothetical protein